MGKINTYANTVAERAGSLLSREIGFKDIGATVGYALPIAVTALATPLGAGMMWIVGATTAKQELGVANPICKYSAFRGYELGKRLDKILGVESPDRTWVEDIKNGPFKCYIQFRDSRKPLTERVQHGGWY